MKWYIYSIVYVQNAYILIFPTTSRVIMDQLGLLEINLIPGLVLQQFLFLVLDCPLQQQNFQEYFKEALPPWARYYGGHEKWGAYNVAIDLKATTIQVEEWAAIVDCEKSKFTIFSTIEANQWNIRYNACKLLQSGFV